MSDFSASYLEIDEDELVDFLLKEAGQSERSEVNPQELLDYLKLRYIAVDLAREVVGIQSGPPIQAPRALISFHDRLIATDSSLDPNRTRFSVLHEIAHYILPHHQNSLYLCDQRAMGFDTPVTFEQEANRIAARMLFLADRFDIEANSHPICAASVKKLALQYQASFEATARRLAERTYRDCMFMSFKEDQSHAINSDKSKRWNLRYCIPSPSFRHKYFAGFTRGSVPQNTADQVATFSDIAQSCTVQTKLTIPGGSESKEFRAEYFHNSFNIFCLLTPNS